MFTLYAKVSELKKYVKDTLSFQILFSLACSALCFLILGGFALFNPGIKFHTVILISFAVGTFLFQDYLRRVFFILKRAKQSLVLDIISNGLLPLSYYVLYELSILNLTTTILSTTILLAISSIVGLLFLKRRPSSFAEALKLFKEHWKFGRFLFWSSLLQWSSGNLFIVGSGFILGPVAIGIVRIVQNLFGVLNVFFSFLENIIPIRAAETLNKNGYKALKTYMKRSTKRFLLPFAFGLLLITVFQEQIIEYLYGLGSTDFKWIVPLFSCLYIFVFFGTMLRFLIRTLEQNRIIFIGYLATTILSSTIMVPLLYWLDVYGVALGLIVTQILSIHIYLKNLKKPIS